MTKPRILILTLAYFPFVGGAEVALKEITDRLPDFEFDVISADLTRGRWPKYTFPVTAYREASRRHAEKKYDLVWAMMANQAGMAGALFKKRYPSVPFLLTLQEGDDLNSLAYRLRLLGPKLFGVFTTPDRIQAISNYLANWGRAMGATCPIVVIPNGVNLEQIPELTKNWQPRMSPMVITTSRLVKKNGVDTLIESLRFLPNNVHLQILGTGPEEKTLKQLVLRLQLNKRVEFLGQVAPSKIPNHLAQADVFARPSRSEGLGNSFLEAMAAGVPVIGTPVGGIPDFLEPGETGWFAAVNDPRSVAAQITHILDLGNKTEVVKVVSQAAKMVRTNYSWVHIAGQFEQLLTSML